MHIDKSRIPADMTEKEYVEAVIRTRVYDGLLDISVEHCDDLDPRTNDILTLTLYLLSNPDVPVPCSSCGGTGSSYDHVAGLPGRCGNCT